MGTNVADLIQTCHPISHNDRTRLEDAASSSSGEEDGLTIAASDQPETRHQEELSVQQMTGRSQIQANRRIEKLKQKLTRLESRRSSEETRFKVAKEILQKLVFTETSYLDAIAIPENERSLRDIVIIQVYKQLEDLTSQILKLKSTIGQLEKSNSGELERSQKLSEENIRIKKQFFSKEDEFITEIEQLQARNRKLSDEYACVFATLEDLQFKAKHLDEWKERSDHFEKECTRLTQELSPALDKLKLLSEEHNRVTANLCESEQTTELLRLDKAYLERESANIQDKICQRDSEIVELKQSIRNIKQQRDEAQDRTEKLRLEWKVQYEDRLNMELDRLQKSNGKELDEIRIQQKQAYEREILGLKEHQNVLITEKERAMIRFEEMRSAYDKVRGELQSCQCALETQIQELRSQLKVKCFEFDRISIAYEQSTALQRKLSQSNERLSEENEIYKKQYYEIRADSARAITELSTANENLKERVHVYEKLELELDAALVCTEDDNLADEKSKKRIQISSSVPSMPSRRLKHSIALAQRLLQKQKEMSALKEELHQAQNSLRSKEDELQSLRSEMDHVGQPYVFLIDSIKDRDQQIKRSQALIEQLYQQLRELQQENEFINQKTAELEAEIRSLLKRKSISVQQEEHRETPGSTNDICYAARDDTKRDGIKGKCKTKLPSWCERLARQNKIHEQLNVIP